MKLTIATINLNNLDGLQRTLPSIFAQTYTEYELIVVDGASTDGSKEFIASQQRVDIWVSEPDHGIYEAMNKAVRLAHGDYCLFMNSGDIFFSPQALEQSVDSLDGCDYIAGHSVFVENFKSYTYVPPCELSHEYLFINALNHQALFTRTEILRQYPYNENMRIVSDWEQYFRTWYLHGCTYKKLNAYVAVFFLDGISTVNWPRQLKERDECVRRLIADSEGEKKQVLKESYEKFLKEHPWMDPAHKEDNAGTKPLTRKERKRKRRNKYRERLRRKLEKSLRKASPFQRDLSVVRYGLKYFFKDLFLWW